MRPWPSTCAPSFEFSGARPGFDFNSGPLGVGYYKTGTAPAGSKPGSFYTWQVWSKPLPEGRVAVLLLNTGVDTTALNVTWQELKAKYPQALSCYAAASHADANLGCNVRDVWQQRDLGPSKTHFQDAELASHDSRFLVIG